MTSVYVQVKVLRCNVLARSDWCRKEYTSGIESLEDSLQVALSRDFLDEHRRKAFRAQLLVHAEEIDFASVQDTARDTCQC